MPTALAERPEPEDKNNKKKELDSVKNKLEKLLRQKDKYKAT